MPSINNYNLQCAFERANYTKGTRLSSNTKTQSPKGSNRSGTGMPPQATPGELQKEPAGLRHIVIQFSIHEETGKTMIKIVDKDSNEVIREIPSREDLERSARLRMYAGRLFDAIA